MTDQDIHRVREKAEQLAKMLKDFHRQLDQERAAYAQVVNDLGYSVFQKLADHVTEHAYEVQDEIVRAVDGIEATLDQMPEPEMPPLDLSNVPTPVMYGATDEEAAKHGMTGSVRSRR